MKYLRITEPEPCTARLNPGRLLKSRLSFGLAVLLISSTSATAQNRAGFNRQKACRVFVQKFYDWYSADEGGFESVLEHSALDDELRQLMSEEVSWQNAHKDEPDFDYDPFLSTNSGPKGRYVAGRVTLENGHYRVEVYQFPLNWYGPGGRPEHKRAVATPEVRFKGSRCVFVNFHYDRSEHPENDDLLSILHQYAAQREKEPPTQ